MLFHLLFSAFQWILNTSWMVCVLILFIIMVRLLLVDRLKPRWSYLLWVIVAIRLLLPWAPESSFSLFNIFSLQNQANLTISAPFETNQELLKTLSQQKPNQIPNYPVQQSTIETNQPSIMNNPSKTDSSFSFMEMLSLIWLLGVLLTASIMIKANIAFALTIKGQPRIREEKILFLFRHCKDILHIKRSVILVETSLVSSPTLTGIFRPKLLMPTNVINLFDNNQLRYIFLHELSHLKRKDLLMNGIMNVLLALHWFNPLIWFSYHKMREDQELACDSMALGHIKPEESREYALTLIKLLEVFSKPHYLANTVSVAGNKKEMRRRLTMIQTHKGNSYSLSLLGIAVILLISGCSLTNANQSNKHQIQAPTIEQENKMLRTKLLHNQITLAAGSLRELANAEGVTLYAADTEPDRIKQITVHTNQSSKTFQWELNPGSNPSVYVADIDSDGKDEIIIILKATNGFGIFHQESIHVLNMEDLSEVSVADPVKALNQSVTSSITKKDDMVEAMVSWDNKKIENAYSFTNMESWLDRVRFGNIISYSFSNNVIYAGVSGSLSSFSSDTSSYDFSALTVVVEYDSSLNVKNINMIYGDEWLSTS